MGGRRRTGVGEEIREENGGCAEVPATGPFMGGPSETRPKESDASSWRGVAIRADLPRTDVVFGDLVNPLRAIVGGVHCVDSRSLLK